MVRATLTDATAPERFLRKPGGSGLEGGVRLGAGDRVRDLLFGRERHVQRDLWRNDEHLRTRKGGRRQQPRTRHSAERKARTLGVTEYRDMRYLHSSTAFCAHKGSDGE